MIVLRIISSCVKLLESRRVVGGAANKIILGCQAFGLLSEQGVAKNSSEGRGEHSGTERGTEGVRETLERQPKWPVKVRLFA